MASTKSEAQRLLDLIHKERLSEVEKIPKGFYSVEQWAKKWGRARSSSRTYLDIAAEKGIMERRVFRVAIGRYYRRVSYFRAIK